MRLVAGRAALQAHRRMLEHEGPALIAMTFEASGLIGRDRLHLPRQKASMGVVAVQAGHRTFRQLVVVRSLKLGPDPGVTLAALGIDCGRSPRPQKLGAFVDPVTGDATDLIARMSALDAAYVRGLIQVAVETGAV